MEKFTVVKTENNGEYSAIFNLKIHSIQELWEVCIQLEEEYETDVNVIFSPHLAFIVIGEKEWFNSFIT